MGWANLSITLEISKINNIAKDIKNKDPEVSNALVNISNIIKKIEDSMDELAYKVHNLT